MPARSQIRNVFKNVQKKVMNSAQRRLEDQIPAMMESIHRNAINYMRGKFGSMTGNWLNSFGVALYRDGRLVAVANMNTYGDESEPIRTTLIMGDEFKRGSHRHDDKYQIHNFEIDGVKYQGSSEQFYANEEVLSWLSHSWTRSKGFSFRIVSVTEYHKDTARRVILQMSEEIESAGGNIWRLNLG